MMIVIEMKDKLPNDSNAMANGTLNLNIKIT